MQNLPIRKSSLANQVEKILTEQIKTGLYVAGEKLPSDEQLANEFNVSRATIRAAFNALTANRLIVPRQGVGTFVSQAALVTNPLDQSIDFLDLITNSGFEAKFREVITRIITPAEDIAKKLKITKEQRVLEVHKVFLADDHPVIYSQNYIPEWVFEKAMKEDEVLKSGATEPFFGFFRDICHREIQHYLSDVIVGMPSDYPFIIDSMKVDQNTPILIIDEIGFDVQDRPLNYAIEYLPGNRMQFSLIRKCLT